MQQEAKRFTSVSCVCALMNSRKTRGRQGHISGFKASLFLKCVSFIILLHFIVSALYFLKKRHETRRLSPKSACFFCCYPACRPKPSEHDHGIGTTFLGRIYTVLHTFEQMEHVPSSPAPRQAVGYPVPPTLKACQGIKIRL